MDCKKHRSPLWNIPSEEFQQLVANSKTIKEVLAYFGLEHKGSNGKTFYARVAEEGIDITHLIAYRNRPSAIACTIPLENILIENSTHQGTHRLKLRLIKIGLLENKCSICGQLPIWQNKLLSLELDHINGVSNDNRIENLRILCPHCHSQTATFRGKANKKYTYCNDCGVEICKKSEYCQKCFGKINGFGQQKVERPTKDELETLIKEKPMMQIGKMFGVKDNTIRKWAKAYGINLPINMRGYWQKLAAGKI